MLMHNNNFIIKLCAFIVLLSVKNCKTSLQQKQLQAFGPFCDINEGPVRVFSMAETRDSVSSFPTSDNDLFL